jgi:hypothetical protein
MSYACPSEAFRAGGSYACPSEAFSVGGCGCVKWYAFAWANYELENMNVELFGNGRTE